MEPLILASASPQRAALLKGLGIPFDVRPSSVDEDGHGERDPQKRAHILAQEKAQFIAAQFPQRYVLGCDTLVVAPDGTLLEKPRDRAEAESMLRLQSGGTVLVHSGLTLIAPDGGMQSGLSSSSVTFKALSDGEVAWWMGTGLWEGRSGGFQIDGPGQFMIARLEGDWSGVVGLPVFLLGEMLNQAGFPLTGR